MVSVPTETGDNDAVKQLLVVEDDSDMAGSISHALRSDGVKTIEEKGPLVAGRESLRYP